MGEATLRPVARLYDRLTAPERYRLELAALARGDVAELTRLRDTARKKHVEVSDTLGLSIGFLRGLAWINAAALEAACRMLLAVGFADRADDPGGQGKQAAGLGAYLFLAHYAALSRFLADVGLGAESAEGAELLAVLVPIAEARTMTAAEAEAMIGGKAKTGDTLLEQARDLRDGRATG